MLDLEQIYRILDYSYNQRDRQVGESICLAICPPLSLAQQFPMEGKAGEDNSPPHVTVAYLGSMGADKEKLVSTVCEMVTEQTNPIHMKVGKLNKFLSDSHSVIHSQIESQALHEYRDTLKAALGMAGVEIDSKHPDYKPHITLEYVGKDKDPKFSHLRPKGEWTAQNAWLWGFSQPYILQFK